MARRKKKEKLFGPVLVITFMIIFVALLSLILNLIGFDSTMTVINNGAIETTLITVKNIISVEGIQYIIGQTVSNLRLFEPLVLLIISLIGIGICERSGFLYALFSPLKRVKLNIILFVTIFLGIISTIIGDYSYIFLIPIIGVMYKYLGKNPILGIMTVFLGITLGYGTGLVFNYNDYSLALITESAAKADIDSSFGYSLFSNMYIMIASTFILSFILTFIINKFLVIKLSTRYSITEEEQELVVDNKAKKASLLVGLLIIVLIIYMILPIKLPLAGVLLDSSATRYMEKLFGSNSPFGNGISLLITLVLVVCGYVYGKKSGNIKNGHDFSLGLSKNFENLGFMFVLMFFASELTAIISWTNIGNVIGSKLIEFMGNLQFSGLLLIITFFIVVILMSILLPGTMDKWQIASPVIVPLFMQSNITPNFAQFIFKAADGVGKAITPVFIYYIIMLAFLEKYRISEKKQVSVFGVLKDIMPVALLSLVVWLLIIIIWYVMGLPIGVGTYPTI
jgi:aminobenzoyl-glutamate transport protein